MKMMEILLFASAVLGQTWMGNAQANDFQTFERGGLKIEVYQAAEASFGVASVLVTGAQDALLFDAQFTDADAEKVAQHLIASGKNLQAIYISHGDPDFYFGLGVFKKYFPKVIAYAAPATYNHIVETAQGKLDYWSKTLGTAITTNVVLPQLMAGDHLELEGHRFEIRGLEDFPDKTFVWAPSIQTALGGINVFGSNFHVWTADAKTAAAKAAWIDVLQQLAQLNPDLVIPAHGNSQSAFNLKSATYTISYLERFQRELQKGQGSKAIIEAMKKAYPQAQFETALQIGAQVNTDEIPW